MNGFDWIEPHEIRFSKEAGGWLTASWEERRGSVKVKRLFPMTKPDSAIWIGGLGGGEWGLLIRTDGLEPDSSAALENELRICPFVPRIEQIVSIRRLFDQYEWDTVTDCGAFRFQTGPLYEAVAPLPGGKRMVTDVWDQLYLLPPDPDLEKQSRKRLGKWL